MNEKQKTCFVIGPIGAEGTETRKAADFLLRGIIKPSIENFLNLRIWRADEDSQPGMITDKLINDLYESDLVIADLSELNPNAFYELGIRHASEKPTVHIAALGTKLPFDNLGYRAIFYDRSDWDSVEQARRSLILQCEEALSPGFKSTNPVVQALSVKAFRASPRKEENVLADIMERLESIENQTRVQVEKPTSSKRMSSVDHTRFLQLTSAIKNFARSPAAEHLDINSVQIEAYCLNNADEINFRRIMDGLKTGEMLQILKEVADEIPF